MLNEIFCGNPRMTLIISLSGACTLITFSFVKVFADIHFRKYHSDENRRMLETNFSFTDNSPDCGSLRL